MQLHDNVFTIGCEDEEVIIFAPANQQGEKWKEKKKRKLSPENEDAEFQSAPTSSLRINSSAVSASSTSFERHLNSLVAPIARNSRIETNNDTNSKSVMSFPNCINAAPFVADDEDTKHFECPICLDPWKLHGPHRTVALKCGHLFGKR